jgi:hypothetical protein
MRNFPDGCHLPRRWRRTEAGFRRRPGSGGAVSRYSDGQQSLASPPSSSTSLAYRFGAVSNRWARHWVSSGMLDSGIWWLSPCEHSTATRTVHCRGWPFRSRRFEPVLCDSDASRLVDPWLAYTMQQEVLSAVDDVSATCIPGRPDACEGSRASFQ